MDALRRVDSIRGPLITRGESQHQESTIAIWTELGDSLKIVESEAREYTRRKTSEITGSKLISCNNLKCPLFGDNILGRLDTPLRCSTCRSVSAQLIKRRVKTYLCIFTFQVYYCNLRCQKV